MLGLKCLGFLKPVVPVVYTIQEGTPFEGFPKLRTLKPADYGTYSYSVPCIQQQLAHTSTFAL